MDAKKITELFLDLEKDKNLFNVKIKDSHPWNFLRHEILQDIYNDLLNYNIKTVKNVKSRHFLSKINNVFKNINKYLVPLLNFKSIDIKKYDFLVFNYGTFKTIDGKLVNEHSYPIANILKKKYKVAVCDKFGFTKKLDHYQCNLVNTRPLFIKSKFLSFIIKNSKIEIEFINSIHEHVIDTFNFKINKKKYLRLLKFRLIHFKKWKKLYRKTKIKAIFFCHDGSMEEVLKAAQLNNIKTIELQHSIISKLNDFYNYNFKSNYIYTTDYVITWGNGWESVCSSNINLLPLGSLSKFDFKYKLPKKDVNKNILVVGTIKNRNQLSSIAMNLSNKLNDYHIYYKLRPEENKDWKKLYNSDFLPSKNLTIIDHNNKKVDYYIKLCTYIIGTQSSVLFESLFYNKNPLFLVDKHGWYSDYEIFYQNKIGVIVNDEKDIIEYINSSTDIHIDFREKISNYTKEFDENAFFQFLKKI